MNILIVSLYKSRYRQIAPFNICLKNVAIRTYSKSSQNLEECYRVLNIPIDSKQDVVRQAFLNLAKKYHPDSGSPDANIETFVAVENAFRVLSKHNTGNTNNDEVEKIVYDIQHTAPQHRQYLSFEGVGHGTPFQRQKQWQQARAQKAAINVMEHRISKSVASENTLMKAGGYGKKHDIKTKYGFDRLVEDLIQESMSKGEFENLSGKGKPLKDQNTNPYVDFTTHKLNEVLINNGFTPEWITLNKDIDQEIALFKEDIQNARKNLGPYPLSDEEQIKWEHICVINRDIAKSINTKINTFNIIVPLINKQKFHIKFDDICEDILVNGQHSVDKQVVEEQVNEKVVTQTDDLVTVVIKAISDLLTFNKEKKKGVDS